MVKKTEDTEEKKAPVDPEQVAEIATAKRASTLADFSWAVNAYKLSRAKTYVQQNNPELKGKDFEAAVKDRYIELKGLLASEVPSRRGGKRAGRVQNVADNDEDKI